MGTLKYMNLLLYLYTPSKCQIHNIWTVHEHKCLSSFLFFRFPSKRVRERERVSLLIFFLWWSSCGGSFFFYGLIDFMLFLTLAWRTWVPRVRDIFLSSSPRNTGFGSSARYEPCPTTNFSYSLFPLTGRNPHFRFRVPANRLASTFPC